MYRRTCDHGGMSDLELLDCGGGRRLERFGASIVDRPAPAADWIARTPPAEWKRATLRWGKGGWVRGGTARPVAGPRRRPDARVPARGRRPAGRLPGARTDLGVAGPGGGCCRHEPGAPAGGPLAVRVHGRGVARLREGWRPGRPRGFVAARRRLGAPERGAVRPRRGPDPLARRGRPGLRPTRAPARQPLRRRRPRPAQLRARERRLADRGAPGPPARRPRGARRARGRPSSC